MWTIQTFGAAAIAWSIAAWSMGAGAAAPSAAATTDWQAINGASLMRDAKDKHALLIKSEVLLDRAGFSPGGVDGRDSDNFRKAITAFQGRNALDPTGLLDGETFGKLAASSSDQVITEYEIADKDVQGPFTKHIPAGFDAMARLPRLSYTGPREELAERFHMSEQLLAELNPRIDFR